MSNTRHIIFNAHGLSLGDFNDVRWLALTKLARLIPYFILYSLIAIVYALFRRWRRRIHRRKLDAEHQSVEFQRLQEQLTVTKRKTKAIKGISSYYYARMVDARASERQTQAQLVLHQKDALLAAHRHAFQLVAMRAAGIAIGKASTARFFVARRLTFKAAAETAAQVAKRKGVSAELLRQHRHRATQSAALADTACRHDEELLALRRIAFKAVAQAAAFSANHKALLVQLADAQCQLDDSQTIQSTALRVLGANSFAEAVRDKHVRDEELSKAGARTKTLENEAAVLKLTSGLAYVEHAEEIAEKDRALETLQQRSNEQAGAHAAYQAGAQEREAQLASTLASCTAELKDLQRRFDDQATVHATERSCAQDRETDLISELSSVRTDLKFAHEELEAVSIECATAQDMLRDADVRAEEREARITGLKANVPELEVNATELRTDYEERLQAAELHSLDQTEVITALRRQRDDVRRAATQPEDSLPSPPPTPTLSNDGFDSSCTFTGAEDSDEDESSIISLPRLPPPPPVDIRNKRWIGPSLRRGVLLCGVFSGYNLVEKPSPERCLDLIIDDISTVGLPGNQPELPASALPPPPPSPKTYPRPRTPRRFRSRLPNKHWTDFLPEDSDLKTF